MNNLDISPKVREKLSRKHAVTRREVEQCFENREGKLLMDTRAHTKTTPPTLWFLSCTHDGRLLKVVYIQTENKINLKSCFEPDEVEIGIYKRHG